MENLTTHDWAFVAAGIMGCITAVVHGLLLQKLMVKPIREQVRLDRNSARLVPLLLHFSTIFWFLGGVALIIAPSLSDASTVLALSVFVGTLYSFGAVGNFWGTRGKHPGWMLLVITLALIVYGASA